MGWRESLGGDWRWVLHARPGLNAAMRLTTRAHELLSRGGAASGPLRVGAAGLSAAADLALAARLRRSRRSETALHVGVDAADLALWSALSTTAGYSQLATAMNTSHPMAVEAGARYGMAGLAVPGLNAAVAATVARLRGRPVQLAPWVWQVAAVLGGMGIARYARRRRAAVLAQHESDLAAQLVRAELTGLNEVVLGLGNVFDELQRAISLMMLSSPRTPDDHSDDDTGDHDRDTLQVTPGQWKAGVAEQTRQSHVYLADVMMRWQRDHNDQPDLHRVVSLTLDPEIAPIVLLSAGADRLRAELDGFQLSGRHTVTVTSRSVRRLTLGIGDHSLDVAVVPDEVTLAFDPLPGGFAWTALWLAAAAPRDGVRPAAALGPAAAALGLMVWSHRRASGGRRDRNAAIVASSLLSLGASVAQTRAVGTTHIPNPGVPGGIPRVPASLALRGHAFVAELCRAEAGRGARAIGWAAIPATLAVCRRLTPAPRPLREFAAELTWVAMGAGIARSITEGIQHESAELEAELTGDDQHRIAEHGERGRAVARSAARALLTESEQLYELHAPTLEPGIREEVRRRLDQCAHDLAASEPVRPS